MEAANTSSSIPASIVHFVQLDLRKFVYVGRSPDCFFAISNFWTSTLNLAKQQHLFVTGFAIIAPS
ncbi:hypothetical protein IQ259_20535 [Fortiea sp. LEGE XX443]|uniref:hypothetical protein n=1 Tax=Fortiea sp. LEGE XX443 TaxID=1828611 RepID=UPI001882F63C|nr:hypothetical protein [Fortiea sp. LEGE XX443]MBE9007390.1 hypothetical protein [Fortiea sp. LEGE XX443]